VKPDASAIVGALAVLLIATAVASNSAIPSASAATGKKATTVLASLPVSSEVSSGYSRDLFRHWVDADGDGCDTRVEVLIMERVSGDIAGCAVSGGRWVSSYDGVVTMNPSTFDIDHRVPLKEAWDSGAWRWSAATRQAYANDLGYAQALIAVSASSNRSKSDRDPAQWLPTMSRCAYAKSWIGVKYRWRLSVDTAEKSSLARVLASCPPLMAVPAIASRTDDTNAQRPTESPTSGGASSSESGAPSGGRDPRFDTCGAANAAGYGPYLRGQDPEYAWYIDRDKDGTACES
jgi:hypothetical protein